ncbi:MAG: hypothetical protein NT069_23315 [Planctomycetota bacterium]|nr:hypothetical protein [Planctomycetota bacterium]
MTQRIFRGDAPAVAQVTKIAKPATTGPVSLAINGKSLAFSAWDIATIVATWNGTSNPVNAISQLDEFTEITASASGNDLILTAKTAGVPFIVSVAIGGVDASNRTTDEVQTITIGNSPTGGTFTLTFSGATTGAIAYNASAATVQTALEALANIGVSEALVTGPAGGPWVVTFAGALAGVDQPLITGNPASLTGGNATVTIETIANGAVGTNEVQSLRLNGSPTGGTFTLTFSGATTGAIAYNASAATVKTALEGLATIGTGNVNTSGGALPSTAVVITFQGSLAGLSLPLLTGNGGSLTGGTLNGTVAETTAGVTGQNMKQDFIIPDVYSGSDGFIARLPGAVNYTDSGIFNGATSAAEMQTALGPIYGSANVSVTVIAAASGYKAWRIEFINALAGIAATNALIPSLMHLTGGVQDNSGTVQVNQFATGTNEVQTITLSGTPSAGSFALTFSGQTTAGIAYNATAADVKTALEALSNIGTGGVTCGGGAFPGTNVTVTFSGNGLQCVNQLLMTIDISGLKVGVNRTTPGVTGVAEVQRVTINGSPFGGTLTLTLGTTTSAIAWNAAAGAVQTALEALAAVGAGNVVCAGGPFPAAITATFAKSLGNLAQMTATPSLNNGTITIGETTQGGVNVGVTLQTRSEGPEHWDCANNWTPLGVPETSDDVILEGDTHLRYGLRQRTTFTADATTDILTVADPKIFRVGQKVRVKNYGGALPGGLAAGTDYYVVESAATALADNRLQLSATLGGTPVNITGAGTGTHTVMVALNSLKRPSRYTGELGLPDRFGAVDAREYRPTSLELDVTTVTIGQGSGPSAGRFRLDTGTAATAVTIYQTGGSTDNDGNAVELVGANAANTLIVLEGEVGVAIRPGQTAQFATIQQRGGTLELGEGVTVGSIDRTGGTLLANNATLAGTLRTQE